MEAKRTYARVLAALAALILVATLVAGTSGCRRARNGHDGAVVYVPEWDGDVTGLVGTIEISQPDGGDGTYFDSGERIQFTVTVTDINGYPIDINTTNLSRARFYIYGPLDQSKTVAAQNLMRVAGPTEYVHLDGTQDGLEVDGNVATFESGIVAEEEPGTYRAVISLRSATETYDRVFGIAEFQVKSPVVETETVAVTRCAPCHQGADNGHFYFHHSDTADGSAGSYEYDDAAIASCKTCHNNAGYANTTDDWDSARPTTPDPLIRRVHGIHVGEELKNPRNTHRMAVTGAVVSSSWVGLNPQGAAPFVGLGLIHGQTSGAEARINNSDGSVTGATWFGLGHVQGEFLIGETVDVVKITDLTQTNYNNIKAANKIGTAVVGNSTVFESDGTSVNVAVKEGYFADYTTVVFPPDARNCTVCHVDDSWKTKPSKYACSACHDNLWWGDDVATPEGFRNHEFEIGDIVNGVPGADRNSALCSGCHSESALSIAESHEVPEFYLADQSTPAPVQPGGGQQAYTVQVTMSPPVNGVYYTLGESPKIYIKTWDNTVNPPVVVNPASITQSAPGSWSTHSIYVSGPRHRLASPVLTSAARGPQLSSTCANAGPYGTLVAGDTFVLSVNGVAYSLTWPGGANAAADVVTWLNGNASGAPAFNTVIKAFVSSGKVAIKNKTNTAGSMIDFGTGSTVQSKLGFPTGRVSLPSTYGNDLRFRTDAWDTDPRVLWGTDPGHPDEICYQLDAVDGLEGGTYHAYVDAYRSSRPDGFAMVTFQVKTDAPSAFIAKNCGDCHGDRHMHLDAGGRHPVDFSLDYCKNCHDYKLEVPAADAWAAYGADPIVKKVHGIHNGAYLQYPQKIYINNPVWGGIRFPQDVRNCTKCHSSDTTGTWNTEPSRLACGSCHDSDSDEAHMLLQTLDPTPLYDSVTKTGGPWSGDEIESCKTCHGEGQIFEPKVVHKISDPYVPPYPR